MSSDAIIAGLKQGNAIELGVLKDMKEGFVALADGMINECLNRSDGLDELTDKLQLVHTGISVCSTVLGLTLHLGAHGYYCDDPHSGSETSSYEGH